MLFFAKYLSLHRDIQPFAEYAVTPCMGVWIETLTLKKRVMEPSVTPCMGVWIETRTYRTPGWQMMTSHPVWVCGLKPVCILPLDPGRARHTLYGCVD